MKVTGTGREVDRGTQGGPVDGVAPLAGYAKPAEKVRGCAARSIELPSRPTGAIAGAVATFTVDREGQVTRFEILLQRAFDGDGPTEQDLNVALAIKRAVERCEWSPGTDPSGAPVDMRVVMPVKFAGVRP